MPAPPVNSPLNRFHYKISLTLVVLVYLSTEVIQNYTNITEIPNHYQLLDVQPYPNFSASDLRKSFRKLSILYHPDKNHEDADKFLNYRDAYEVLNDNRKRSLYDRYGKEVLDCSYCKLEREYHEYGLSTTFVYYCSLIFLLVTMQVTRGNHDPGNSITLSIGRYWRFALLFMMATLDVWISTRGYDPVFVFSTLAPFQKIQFIRSIYMSFIIALSLLGPQWFEPQVEQNIDHLLQKLSYMGSIKLQELEKSLQFISGPFQGDLNLFQRKVEQFVSN